MKKEFQEEVETTEKTGKSILRELIDTAFYFAAILVFCSLFIRFVGQRTIVVGDSMQNNLYDGDNLIVEKLSYRFSDPERFDIVVFPCKANDNTLYIKRIIGLPGEKIQIDAEGNIYINDEILEEDYGKEVITEPGLAKDPIYLGADEYFVLGDNRNYSEDSRYPNVGVVDSSIIVGRAFFRIYPFEDFGSLNKE